MSKQASWLKIGSLSLQGVDQWTKLFLVLAFLAHGGLVAINWTSGNLPGHEFRQTQTALSILFIHEEQDYSLAYPTPLFGPPWSIPMEFPLYQWSVALLMEFTGWSLATAARSVTLVCFYIALIGLSMLLRRWRIERSATRLALGMILLTPVYLFYSRAVLIESMALALSIWFLFAFSKSCESGKTPWVVLSIVLGSLAGLVKVTTLFAWCLPAAVIGLSWSISQFRLNGMRGWLKTVAVGLFISAPIGLVNWWWITFADRIKAASPGGQKLRSDQMIETNWGTWHDRLSAESIGSLGFQMTQALLPPLVLIAVVVMGLWKAHGVKRRVFGLLGWFLATLVSFPVLYHRHDYYFFAIAVAPIVACAIMIDSRLRQGSFRWLAAVQLMVVLGFSTWGYVRNYAPLQCLESNGGTGLTNFIRDMLPADSALVIIGQDWAPVIPYYSQRKALMIRDNIARDPVALDRHLGQLSPGEVGALIITRNSDLFEDARLAASQRFDLDEYPSLQHRSTLVYLSNTIRESTLHRLQDYPNYAGITDIGAFRPPAASEPIIADQSIHEVTPRQAAQVFGLFSLPPDRYRCQFGFSGMAEDGRNLLGSHPDSDIWVPIHEDIQTVAYSLGVSSQAYASEDSTADGVVFSIYGIRPDGTETRLIEHDLNPFENMNQRGILDFSIGVPEGLSELRFSVRGKESLSRDWAFWGQVTFE